MIQWQDLWVNTENVTCRYNLGPRCFFESSPALYLQNSYPYLSRSLWGISLQALKRHFFFFCCGDVGLASHYFNNYPLTSRRLIRRPPFLADGWLSNIIPHPTLLSKFKSSLTLFLIFLYYHNYYARGSCSALFSAKYRVTA